MNLSFRQTRKKIKKMKVLDQLDLFQKDVQLNTAIIVVKLVFSAFANFKEFLFESF